MAIPPLHIEFVSQCSKATTCNKQHSPSIHSPGFQSALGLGAPSFDFDPSSGRFPHGGPRHSHDSVPSYSVLPIGCPQPPTSKHAHCVSDCSADFLGDENQCGPLRDCRVGECTEVVLSSYFSDATIPPICIGARPEEIELLRAAWRVLQENIDLVYWSVCHIVGYTWYPVFADNLAKLIFGQLGYEATIIVWDVDVSSGGANPNSLLELAASLAAAGLGFPGVSGVGGVTFPANFIHIPRGANSWQWHTALWNNGTTADRCTAALLLSSLLLHELCHEVWLNSITDTIPHSASGCYGTYEVENVYYWALYKRYRPVLENSSCVMHDDSPYFDCFFGDGSGRHPRYNKRVWCTASQQGGSNQGFFGDVLELIFEYIKLIWDAFVWAAEQSAPALREAGRFILDILDPRTPFEILIRLVRWIWGNSGSGTSGGCDDICQYCPELCTGCRLRLSAVGKAEMMDCFRRAIEQMIQDDLPDTALESQGMDSEEENWWGDEQG